MNSDYLSNQWGEKRLEILKRDNYTCQRAGCARFNPSLGEVIFDKDGQPEIHYFHSYGRSYNNYYQIDSSKLNQSFYIDLQNTWFEFPILQVHHKSYKQGQKIWETDNDDLITLCKDCHKEVHKVPIPKYDSNNHISYVQVGPIDSELNSEGSSQRERLPISKSADTLSNNDVIISVTTFSFSEKINNETAKKNVFEIIQSIVATYIPSYNSKVFEHSLKSFSYDRYLLIDHTEDRIFFNNEGIEKLGLKKIFLKNFEKDVIHQSSTYATIWTDLSCYPFFNEIEGLNNSIFKNVEIENKKMIECKFHRYEIEF